MSSDARYLFIYESLPYESPSPIELDIEYLSEKYGGIFTDIDGRFSIFWDKPKYTLSRREFLKLNCDQIFERKDCELWELVYPKQDMGWELSMEREVGRDLHGRTLYLSNKINESNAKIMELYGEIDKWKHLYRKSIRKPNNMMESQNAITESEADNDG